MPRGDRTGPQGMGPMTGRAAGFCVGNTVPGYMHPGMGGGRGMGMGGGRGSRRGRGFGFCWQQPVYPVAVQPPYAPVAPVPQTAESEIALLREQAVSLKSSLEAIDARIQILSERETDEK